MTTGPEETDAPEFSSLYDRLGWSTAIRFTLTVVIALASITCALGQGSSNRLELEKKTAEHITRLFNDSAAGLYETALLGISRGTHMVGPQAEAQIDHLRCVRPDLFGGVLEVEFTDLVELDSGSNPTTNFRLNGDLRYEDGYVNVVTWVFSKDDKTVIERMNIGTKRAVPEPLPLGRDWWFAWPFDKDKPSAVAIDISGNLFFVLHREPMLRRIDRLTGEMTVVAGTMQAGFAGDGGPATEAKLDGINGIAVGADGTIYISDGANKRIRRIDGTTGVITTIAGTGIVTRDGWDPLDGPRPPAYVNGGSATNSLQAVPGELAVDIDGNLIMKSSGRSSLYKIDLTEGTIHSVAEGDFSGLAIGPDGAIYTSQGGGILKFNVSAETLSRELLIDTDGVRIQAMAMDPDGNLYVSSDEGGGAVHRFDIWTREFQTVLGGEDGLLLELGLPWALATDRDGNLFVADHTADRIHRVDPNLATASLAWPAC